MTEKVMFSPIFDYTMLGIRFSISNDKVCENQTITPRKFVNNRQSLLKIGINEF